MTPARRMGQPGSAVWISMLDAAEDVLREDGYAALTSRNVADRIGVKQRLVYYYFATMDDLIVETFKRLAARELERLANALRSENPLHDMWSVFAETADTRLVSEFMALANRNEALRTQVKQYILKTRKMQVAALTVTQSGPGDGLPPAAAILFATGAALLLHREAALGIRAGHAETLKIIQDFIASRGKR